MKPYLLAVAALSVAFTGCTVFVGAPTVKGLNLPEEQQFDSTILRSREYLPNAVSSEPAALVGRVLKHCNDAWSISRLRWTNNRGQRSMSNSVGLMKIEGVLTPDSLRTIPAFRRVKGVKAEEIVVMRAHDVLQYKEEKSEIPSEALRRLAASSPHKECAFYFITQVLVTSVTAEVFGPVPPEGPSGPVLAFDRRVYTRVREPSVGVGIGVVLVPFTSSSDPSRNALAAATSVPALDPGSNVRVEELNSEVLSLASTRHFSLDENVAPKIMKLAGQGLADYPSSSDVEQILDELNTFVTEQGGATRIDVNVWASFMCHFCPRYPYCLKPAPCP